MKTKITHRPFSVGKSHEQQAISAGLERVVGDRRGDQQTQGTGEGVLPQVGLLRPVWPHFGCAHSEESATLAAAGGGGGRVVVRRQATMARGVSAVRVEETLDLNLHDARCIVSL